MATQKQLDANRRNSQKSTGPASFAGKAASSMNALKTGIHAKSVIITGEKASDLQQLIDEYYAAYQPSNPVARGLVDDLIRTEWTLRRLDTSEASLWNYQDAQAFRPVPDTQRQGKVVSQNAKIFAALQRRLDATRRGRDRALKLLGDPLPAPAPIPEPAPAPALTLCPSVASPEIGFVPSPLAQPSLDPAPPSESTPDSRPEVVLS
ncbi:MAG: hypothetical protein ABI806_22185 [Candidatus Solibacter sp.]